MRYVMIGLLTGSLLAADAPTKPERFTFTVHGLFAPDRVRDLQEVFADWPDVKLVSVDFAEAEMTVEFDPRQMFPGNKADQLPERMNEHLRHRSRGGFGVQPRRTIPRDKLEEVVIAVQGLDCRGCALAAYDAVADLEGVYCVTSSFKDGRVTARIDPSKTNRAQLEERLRKRGVTVGKP